jgi:hypothetical protein
MRVFFTWKPGLLAGGGESEAPAQKEDHSPAHLRLCTINTKNSMLNLVIVGPLTTAKASNLVILFNKNIFCRSFFRLPHNFFLSLKSEQKMLATGLEFDSIFNRAAHQWVAKWWGWVSSAHFGSSEQKARSRSSKTGVFRYISQWGKY